jgi:hypothetical protein
MRLAGLRVATDLRDFVAGLPRRAPLAPAFADLLADAAFAALAFLALFLLGLVGFRAMAGLLAGPYTGRTEGAIATRAGARRGRGSPRERRRRSRSRRGRTKSRRGAGRGTRFHRSRARRGPCRSRNGSRGRRSRRFRGRRSRRSRGWRNHRSRGCRSRGGSRSCRSRSGFRGRRLSRRGFPGGGALGSRTLGLLGGRPASRLFRLDRLAATRGRPRAGLALRRRALSGLLLGPGGLRLRFPSSFSHNVLLFLFVRLHYTGGEACGIASADPPTHARFMRPNASVRLILSASVSVARPAVAVRPSPSRAARRCERSGSRLPIRAGSYNRDYQQQ